MYVSPIKIKKMLSPKLSDLSKKLPASAGPTKLDNSNKIMNEAFAEISFLCLNRSDSIASEIVYMK